MPLTDAEKMTNRISVAKRLELLTCPADKSPAAFPTADTWRRTYSMSEARMTAVADPLVDSGDDGVGVCHSITWGVWPKVACPAVLRWRCLFFFQKSEVATSCRHPDSKLLC